MSRPRLAVLAVLVAGCTDPAETEPTWLTLSAVPGVRELSLADPDAGGFGAPVRVRRDGGTYLTTTIPRATFTARCSAGASISASRRASG